MEVSRFVLGRSSMRRFVRAIGVLTLCGLVCVGWIVASLLNEASPVRVASDAVSLEDLIVDWASHPSIPGVILRVDHGERTLFEGAAGFIEKSRRIELTPETPFHTASVGKLFTAATLLRLSERGLVELDDPVAAYLGDERLAPFFHFDGNHYSSQVTVRQLLGHRSGLGNTDDDIGFGLTVLFNPNRAFSPDDLLKAAARVPAVGSPGAQEVYSSPGYYLAGLLIEEVSAQPYHSVVRTEIFDRLGMTETREASEEWDRRSSYLHHYAGWVDLSEHNPSFEFADGGFVTTAHDLSLFGKAFLSGELFDERTTADAFIAPWDGEGTVAAHRGLGPGVVRRDGDPVMIWHSGYWGVYHVVYPNAGIVVSMTLAQSRADVRTFWNAAKPLVEALAKVDLETGVRFEARANQ